MNIQEEIKSLRNEISRLEKEREDADKTIANKYRGLLTSKAEIVGEISKNMYLVNVVQGRAIPFTVERFRIMINFNSFNLMTKSSDALEYSKKILEGADD